MVWSLLLLLELELAGGAGQWLVEGCQMLNELIKKSCPLIWKLNIIYHEKQD